MNDEDLARMDACLGGVGGEVEDAYRYGFEAARRSRWAAFSDDDLDALADVDEFGAFPNRSYFDQPLYQELKAEIQRRSDAQ